MDEPTASTSHHHQHRQPAAAAAAAADDSTLPPARPAVCRPLTCGLTIRSNSAASPVAAHL